MNVGEMTVVAIVKPDNATGTYQIASRDNGSGTRHWQLAQSGTRVVFTGFNASTSAAIQTPAGVLAAGVWAMITARVDANGKIQIWVNGVLKSWNYMLAGPMRSTSGSLLRLGARSTTPTESFDGTMAYFAWYGATDTELRNNIETRARLIASGKGITLP